MPQVPSAAQGTARGRVVRIDPLSDPRWDAFLNQAPQARLGHSSAWLEVLQRTFGFRPLHLAIEREARLEGVLPLLAIESRLTGRRLVSLPYSGPAGPLGSSVEAVDGLIEAAAQAALRYGFKYLNLRSEAGRLGSNGARSSTTAPFVCSQVAVPSDPAEAWDNLRTRSLKVEIRQARRRGVEVRLSDDPADLRTFYRLYAQTVRKHGTPLPPFKLFANMWRVMKPREMLYLQLAAVDGRVIGAQLCFGFKDILSAGYLGVDYRALPYYHQVKLIQWSAIELASAGGFRSYDLLQSHVNNQGLRWYKRSFQAREIPTYYHYFPKAGGAAALPDILLGRRWGIGKVIRSVVRRLPDSGLRLLGSATFKHLG